MRLKSKAVFPGTFDPITLGHINIVERALDNVVEKLIIAVYDNDKKSPLFQVEQRVKMIVEALRCFGDRVEVMSFSGLFIDFAQKYDVALSIRGVRSLSDFEYEFRMCYINNKLDNALETIFIPASEKHQYISSSFVREIAQLGGDVAMFVPPNVREALKQRINHATSNMPEQH